MDKTGYHSTMVAAVARPSLLCALADIPRASLGRECRGGGARRRRRASAAVRPVTTAQRAVSAVNDDAAAAAALAVAATPMAGEMSAAVASAAMLRVDAPPLVEG